MATALVIYLGLTGLNQLSVRLAREDLARIARAAAGTVDGDLHRTLQNSGRMDAPEYRRALEPLVRFHRNIPEIEGLYTLAGNDEGLYWVLDTASAPRSLKLPDGTAIFSLMQPVTNRSEKEYEDVLASLQNGEVLVRRTFFPDKPGAFLRAHAPIRDSSGAVAGVVEVDMREPALLWSMPFLTGFGRAGISLLVGMALGLIVYRIRSREQTSASEVRRSLDAKSEVEARDRRIIQAMGQIIYHHRFDVDEHLWEGDYQKILGYSSREMAATTQEWLNCIHPDERGREEASYIRAAREESTYNAIYRYRRKDGSYAWIHDRGVMLRDAQGKAICADGVLEDITSRKEAEEEKSRLEKRNSLLIQALGEVVYHLDIKTGGMQWHGDHQAILGFSREEMPVNYQAWSETVHEDDREQWKAACDESVREGKLCEIEYRHRCRDGSYKWVLDRSVPTVHEGEVLAFDGILRDISTRKEAEEQALAAKEAAEIANRAKSEFLAVMSHEIRTPLNGVIGFSSLLFDTQPTEKQKEYLKSICLCSEMLLKLLNDVLDLSKIESGKMEIERTEFPLQGCIREVLEIHATQARHKGITLSSHCAGDMPAWLVGDQVRFRQVLTNLVGNALKFTEQGEVTVIAERCPGPDGESRFRVIVRDTGIGIPEEKRDRLFKAFSQVDSSTTRKYGGTGLGLAISARLVRMMGGLLEVKSLPGRGSEFYFDLPLVEAEAPAHPVVEPEGGDAIVPADSALAALRVLVVEDNGLNRKVILRMLQNLGCKPDMVCNGRECLDAVSQGEFDLIFMDIQMPEMDGYEATARLRTAGSKVWITALTADAMPEDPLRCRIAGMNDYLSKPITPERLKTALVRCVTHLPSLSGR